MNEMNQLGTLTVEAKRDLLKTLLSIRDGQSTGVFPLSSGQQGLWFVYQLAPSSPAYNFVVAARLPADVDLDALGKSFQALLCRHPALRTRFSLRDGKPIQKIDPDLPVELPRVDAREWSDEQLLRHLESRGDAPFDLEKGPSLRVEFYQRRGGEWILLLVFHHIIADLWSMDLLIEELKEIYASRRRGQEVGVTLPRSGLAEYLRNQFSNLHGPRGQKALAYWLKELGGPLPVLDLPTDRPRPAIQNYKGSTHTWRLPAKKVARLRALAGQLGTTMFPLLLSAFELLLHRYTGQGELLVGVTTADRGKPEWEKLVGYFLNQIVLRNQLQPGMTFLDLVAQVRDKLYHGLENNDYPFGELVKRLQPHRDPSRSPVFQTMFIWDRPRAMAFPESVDLSRPVESSPGTLTLEPILMEQRGAPTDLTLIVFESDTLTARLCYNTDLFHRSTIERMARHFEALLDHLVIHPQAELSEVPMLTPTERSQLLEKWGLPAPLDITDPDWLTVFERNARDHSQAVALEQEDRQLTYGELNRQANQLARLLEREGVQAGDIVALHLPRVPEMIVAVLAAWKLRAAWLYLDPAHPAQRVSGMVADSVPAVILSAGGVPSTPIRTLLLADAVREMASLSVDNPARSTSPDDWAYIIYTSGSTGKPKGTILTQRGLLPLLTSQKHFLEVGSSDRVLLYASLSFDASVYEMLMALGTGARLVLPTAASVLPGPALASLLRDRGISVVTMPPSILGALPADDLPALRLIMVAGEACPADLVARWKPGRRFVNAYGPTEATVCATWTECEADGKPPTIGRPMAQTSAAIVDANFQPVPIGVPGELLLSGPGLARGYLGQPGLTAERFQPNPFQEGDVAYRTGDLVRWREDGQIEFLGRLDHQVKLRGHRIELEEIQEVLRGHAAVSEAAVVLREDAQRGPALAAYVVARSSGEFPVEAVREHLRERLPVYMLPATITVLEKMPLTGYGKIDRKALARIAPKQQGSGKQVSPRTPTERTLARIWCQVLGLESVGIHDNFFDLGGASIQTVELASRAAEEGLALTPELLFQYQTIAELAEMCAAAAPSQAMDTAVGTVTQGDTQRHTEPGALIESLGVYIPPGVLNTDDVLKNCKVPLDFPLERFTGIRSRRVVGENEFSIDLARKAVAECLSRSRYAPDQIDLIVCCNISRYDGPFFRFSLEPTTAARLQREFGLVHALAFDLTNACAGTFTGIFFADSLLRQGLIRNALIVSGEYISHLTRTAQAEIEDFMDSRMACLTLGDAGQAILLEQAPTGQVGFHDLELFTLGRYHNLCVAKVTGGAHGGAIMHTDPVKSAVVTTKIAVGHCLEVLERNRWTPESVRQLIMHQTSERTLDGAVQEINRVLGKSAVHRSNTIYNLAERGNCATNTHMLATYENIQNGKIQPGDRVLYAISGSGLVVGTAVYTFDDLPQRLREGRKQPPVQQPASPPSSLRCFQVEKPIRIGSISHPADASDSVTMLRQAGEDCLKQSSLPRNDIDLVLHTGVYHTDFISEPALATIAAGELGINHDDESNFSRRTFAFDLLNGGAGTLTACLVATTLLQTKRLQHALILASEVENNAGVWPENLLGVETTATAFLLHPSEAEGFLAFGFRSFPEEVERRVSWTGAHEYQPAAYHHRDENLETIYLDCVVSAVEEFLREQKRDWAEIDLVVPSLRSEAFVAELARRWSLPAEKIVAMDRGRGDWFTSSLARGLSVARETNRLRAGQLVLIVEVGAGVQVGCALYRA